MDTYTTLAISATEINDATELLRELAGELGVAPEEVATATVLLHAGRVDLVDKLLAGEMTAHEAVAAAQVGEGA